MCTHVNIIGAGLAGSEAAWQIAEADVEVRLYEMKPARFSPAHKINGFAELVCSNSLRSNDPMNAAGLLKEEMRAMKSLVIKAADDTSVPAGKALAVDRQRFSDYITDRIKSHPKIKVINHEITALDQVYNSQAIENPTAHIAVIATGPLTSEALSGEIMGITGREHLYFYDSVAPIVDGSSLDFSKGFKASRYDYGGDDYWNFPLSRKQYLEFLKDLAESEKVELREFEDPLYFEGCLPIEVMASRGQETLRYGPMKPFGLINPSDKNVPYAVLQLRQEDDSKSMFNMVGFQTRMTWPSQKEVFQKLPGFEKARFLRFGVVHRNTYISSPRLLSENLEMRGKPGLFFAGQIIGVEGYIESAASGLWVGTYLGAILGHKQVDKPPNTTALGSLIWHVVNPNHRNFQPMNINFGLMPIIEGRIPKNRRKELMVVRARDDFYKWLTRTKPRHC